MLRRPGPPVASLWTETAAPARAHAELAGEVRADVAIIGGGYTGLSAALHIGEDGRRPVVIDANGLGWGCSGRNGGVVSAKFRMSFAAAASLHGLEVARRMYAIAHESLDVVEELIDRLGIASAGYARVGQVKGAHNAASLEAILKDRDWMRAEMGDTSVTALSRDAVARETGSEAFVGGVLSSHAGQLHPLNYLGGLAAAAAARGIALFERTPALAIRRERGGVVVETPGGVIRARDVVLATDGYADLTAATAAVRRRIIPFRSAMIATAPLPPEVRAAVMPTGRVYVETRRMMRWFRIAEGRAVFGGRGAFGRDDSEPAFRALEAALVRTFPVLRGTPVTHRWSGLVAMTLDGLPHVGRLGDGTLFAMGYNGTGIATATLMGRYLAALLRGEQPDLALLAGSRFRPIPLYPLRDAGVRLVAGWYGLLDAIGR